MSSRGHGEDPPLLLEKHQKEQGQSEPFFSGTWLISLVAATFFFVISGWLLHGTRSLTGPPLKNTSLHLSEGVAIHDPPLGAEDFQKCNAGLPPVDLAYARADTTLTGKQCGEAEANTIAAALQAAGYTYEATIPVPFIFPGYLQQVLFTLSSDHIAPALKHLQDNAPLGRLGMLVKFFAWGLPVPTASLEAALDPAVISALKNCQLLAPCSNLPNMTTSAAMIFSVPNTTILMATDWASRSTIGMSEEVVPIVNPESLALVFNSPPTKGLDVLDLDSGTGVHGIVAAMRGALSVTILATDTRAARFARFSAWLNGLGGVVSVVQGSSSTQALSDGLLPAGGFGLLLAQPPFLPVPTEEAAARHRRNGGKDGHEALKAVLLAAAKVLNPTGLLALVTEFAVPQFLPAICKGYAIPGMTGSLIVRQQPLPVQDFAAAHTSLATKAEQVGNMKLHGVNAVASGMLFGKRAEKDMLSQGCGMVTLQTLVDPLAWPTPDQSKFNRPCFLSGETNCPETA